MNYSRQIKEELTRDFHFLRSNISNDILEHRQIQEPKNLPQPSKISSKSKIESLKNSLDLEAKQRKVEEYKKRAIESKFIMRQDVEEKESVSPQSSPYSLQASSNRVKNKSIRTDFPKSLISEFSFFDSPTGKDKTTDFIRLTDDGIGRDEAFDVIERLSKRVR